MTLPIVTPLVITEEPGINKHPNGFTTPPAGVAARNAFVLAQEARRSSYDNG